MANLFDLHAKGLLPALRSASKKLNLNVTNQVEAGAAMSRNMDNPVSVASPGFANIWGTPDKFLSEYKNFHQQYLLMIEEELSNSRSYYE